MKLLAQLIFYCNYAGRLHSCAKFEPYAESEHCIHNKRVPFHPTDRICTNKEVHKQIIQDLLNYSPGPNNG